MSCFTECPSTHIAAPEPSLISTFEILIAPLAPRFGPNPGPNADVQIFARRVVQGYFLTISNLQCCHPLSFVLHFTAPPDTSVPIGNNQFSTTNHLYAFNIAGNLQRGTLSNVERCGKAIRYDTGLLTLPAGETGVFALLPNVLNDALRNQGQDSTRALAIRGFVEVSQGAPTTGIAPFVLKQLTETPVLLTPEHRGTFLPNEAPSTNQSFDDLGNPTGPPTTLPPLLQRLEKGLDFDQLNYALPLAEGRARYCLGGGLVAVGAGIGGGLATGGDQSLPN
jgi:hypothetical protein